MSDTHTNVQHLHADCTDELVTLILNTASPCDLDMTKAGSQSDSVDEHDCLHVQLGGLQWTAWKL